MSYGVDGIFGTAVIASAVRDVRDTSEASRLPDSAPRIRLYNQKRRKEDFWKNLPFATKLFMILSTIDSILVIIFGIYQIQLSIEKQSQDDDSGAPSPWDTSGKDDDDQSAERIHISASYLIMAVFYLVFVFDAILKENFMELIAAAVISVIFTARLAHYLIAIYNASWHFINGKRWFNYVLLALALAVEGATLVLAWLTWTQFGWRMYSKFAADMRVRSGHMKKKLYILVNRFTTIIKVDIMFSFVLLILTVAITIQNLVYYDLEDFQYQEAEEPLPELPLTPTQLEAREGNQRDYRDNNINFLVVSIVSFVVNIVWTIFSYSCTKRELKVAVMLLTVLVLVPLALVAVQFYLYKKMTEDGYDQLVKVESAEDEDNEDNEDEDNGDDIGDDAQTSYTLAFVIYVLARLWTTIDMNFVIRQFTKFGGANKDLTLEDNFQNNPFVHPALVPLMKGDWLYKPAQGAPKKRRFFQLSTDYTQLRWAWDKAVYLFYMESITSDLSRLEITLKMHDRDRSLTLGFQSEGQYNTWFNGLCRAKEGLEDFRGGLSTVEAHDRQTKIVSTNKNMARRVWDAIQGKPVQSEEQLRMQYRNIVTEVLRYLDKLAQLERQQTHSESLDGRDDTVPLNPETSTSPINMPSPTELVLPSHHSIRNFKDAAAFFRQLKNESNNENKEVLGVLADGLERVPGAGGVAPHGNGRLNGTNGAGEGTSGSAKSSPRSFGHQDGQAQMTFTAWVTHQEEKSDTQLPAIHIEQIPFNQLTMGKYLGRGGESAVHAALYNQTVVAVKPITRPHEIHIYALAGGHDNIVQLRGVSKINNQNEQQLLVMEYCPRGNLDVYLHHQGSGPEKRDRGLQSILQIARQIARGMLHLHTRSPPIQHRDLKPGNVFISHGFSFKIGDFGQSRTVKIEDPNARIGRSRSQGALGTAAYAAPELYIDSEAVDPTSEENVQTVLKSDVYSFGILLYEMVTRKRPFHDKIAEQIGYAWWNQPEEMMLPRYVAPSTIEHPEVMNQLLALIESCTHRNAVRRPTFLEILDEFKTMLENTRQVSRHGDNHIDVV